MAAPRSRIKRAPPLSYFSKQGCRLSASVHTRWSYRRRVQRRRRKLGTSRSSGSNLFDSSVFACAAVTDCDAVAGGAETAARSTDGARRVCMGGVEWRGGGARAEGGAVARGV